MSKRVIDFPVFEGSETLHIVETVVVGENTIELPVKIAVNCSKATYKITASLTTKAVHPTNDDMRDAIADKVGAMIRTAMDKAEERRRFWDEQNGDGDSDQLTLGFDQDEDDAMEGLRN